MKRPVAGFFIGGVIPLERVGFVLKEIFESGVLEDTMKCAPFHETMVEHEPLALPAPKKIRRRRKNASAATRDLIESMRSGAKITRKEILAKLGRGATTIDQALMRLRATGVLIAVAPGQYRKA